MNDKQKKYAIIAGAAIALVLAYKWYTGQQTATASTGATAPDTASSDYASLAGQEQSDVAGLQSDIAGLQSQVAGLGTSTGGDGTSTTDPGTVSTGPGWLDPNDPTVQGLLAAIGAGQQPVNRATVANITPHAGGAFYDYYVKATGKKPPATVQTTNIVYRAWKAGVKATSPIVHPHPSAPKQTQVAHPNGNHQQQKHVNPSVKTVVPTAKSKVGAKPPPPKTKPKASGKRK